MSLFEAEMSKGLSKLAADVIPNREMLKKANESVNKVSFYLVYHAVRFDTYVLNWKEKNVYVCNRI